LNRLVRGHADEEGTAGALALIGAELLVTRLIVAAATLATQRARGPFVPPST
jgi:hypothetical protein